MYRNEKDNRYQRSKILKICVKALLNYNNYICSGIMKTRGPKGP